MSTATPSPPSEEVDAAKGTVGFKQGILAYLNDEPELYLHVYLERCENIALLKFEGAVFAILTTDYLLQHPGTDLEKDRSCYIHVEYDDSAATLSGVRHFDSKLPRHPLLTNKADHADYFLPLGWLVEDGITTRYVCLLNISTSPMSVWLMYDYVFVDVEDNDSVVQLGDTNMVYDGYPDGGAPRKMKKAKDLLEGQDMVLLYLDIADWNPEKAKVLPKPATKFCLGPSTRAITRKPPKDLLDAVTIADQGPPPSELIEHWY